MLIYNVVLAFTRHLYFIRCFHSAKLPSIRCVPSCRSRQECKNYLGSRDYYSLYGFIVLFSCVYICLRYTHTPTHTSQFVRIGIKFVKILVNLYSWFYLQFCLFFDNINLFVCGLQLFSYVLISEISEGRRISVLYRMHIDITYTLKCFSLHVCKKPTLLVGALGGGALNT